MVYLSTWYLFIVKFLLIVHHLFVRNHRKYEKKVIKNVKSGVYFDCNFFNNYIFLIKPKVKYADTAARSIYDGFIMIFNIYCSVFLITTPTSFFWPTTSNHVCHMSEIPVAYVKGLGAIEGTFFPPREPQPETKLIPAEQFRTGPHATRLNDQPTCWHLRVREMVMVRGGEGEDGREGYGLPARRNQQPSRSMTTVVWYSLPPFLASSAQGEGRDCPWECDALATHAVGMHVFLWQVLHQRSPATVTSEGSPSWDDTLRHSQVPRNL